MLDQLARSRGSMDLGKGQGRATRSISLTQVFTEAIGGIERDNSGSHLAGVEQGGTQPHMARRAALERECLPVKRCRLIPGGQCESVFGGELGVLRRP